MAGYNKETVAPLLRRRKHLREVGADLAKLAEIDQHLRQAGYDPDSDELDGKPEEKRRVEAEKPVAESGPVNRRAPERQTADAPTGKPEATPAVASDEKPKGVTSDFLSGNKTPKQS